MKAEHRKELETNLLADRMGNLIQRMKGGQKRRWMVITFAAALGIVVFYIVYKIFQGDTQAEMRAYLALDAGDWQVLMRDTENSFPVKAAKMHYAQFLLWDQGVRLLGSNTKEALTAIEVAAHEFERLEKACAGDRDLESEARYALAIVDETRAGLDIKNLANAKQKYKAIVDDYYDQSDPKKNTMWGALAQKRLKDLEENNAKLTDFYQRLSKQFNLPERDKERRAPAPKKQ